MRMKLSFPLLACILMGMSQADVVFLKGEAAKAKLTQEDGFITRLSPFDRAARLCMNRQVDEEEYKIFLAANVLDWTADEEKWIGEMFQAKAKFIRDSLKVKVPETVYLIKTTGKEEGDAPYTRMDAMVFPKSYLSKEKMGEVLSHELFHILSRSNPKLRLSLYGLIGYKEGNEIQIPSGLADLRITNPDGFENRYYIDIESGAGKATYIPFLKSKAGIAELKRDTPFFAYLEFSLYQVENKEGKYRFRLEGGKPVPLGQKYYGNYLDIIGRNTQYIINPDEILADNFMFIVDGKKAFQTPDLRDKIVKACRSLAN